MRLLAHICCSRLSLLLARPRRSAVQPDEMLTDPALEARARALSQELRCMVCQNQSIDDSDAPLARDLRVLVRERLTAGDSDQQVLDFLVARYGEFVLLKPRFRWHTALLWLDRRLACCSAGRWRSCCRRGAAAVGAWPMPRIRSADIDGSRRGAPGASSRRTARLRPCANISW